MCTTHTHAQDEIAETRVVVKERKSSHTSKKNRTATLSPCFLEYVAR